MPKSKRGSGKRPTAVELCLGGMVISITCVLEPGENFRAEWTLAGRVHGQASITAAQARRLRDALAEALGPDPEGADHD